MKTTRKILVLLLCVIMVFASGSAVYADSADMSAACVDSEAGTYRITISNYNAKSGTSLRTAIWCKQDQSDLKWYTVSGTQLDFNVAEIGSTGKYTAHCYAFSSDGSAEFVSGVDFNVSSLPAAAKSISGSFTDSSKSVYRITVTDPLIASASSLRAGVWTKTNGQDDLMWVELTKSGNSAYADIKISSLKHTGDVFAHVYAYSSSGAGSFVNGISFTAPASSNTAGTVSAVENVNDGSAAITASGITSSSQISKVSVAVWSASDQSDLKWYDMTASGSDWKTTMNISNHGFHRAVYYAHCYATAGGTTFFAGGCLIDMQSASAPDPEIKVTVSSDSYTVTVSNAYSASEIKNMKAAVWSSEGGQDDLSWNEMTASGTTWTVSKSLSSLKHGGVCCVHVYYTAKDGTSKYLTGASFETAQKEESLYASGNSSGKRTLVLENSGVSAASFAVWSSTNGQDDLIWYTGQKDSSGNFTVSFDVNNHRHSGTFYTHVYSNGKFVDGMTFKVDPSECATEYTELASSMKIAAETDQMILIGASGTSCTLTMLNKNDDGAWFQLLTTSGQVGSNGIGDVTEWNRKTPVGVYNVTEAFGINADPGCSIKYTQVDSTYYWVDDVDSPYYNKFVTTKTTAKNWNSAEHIIEYTNSYRYCLAFDFNKECVSGAGSAIFIHVGHDSPTLGCIGIPYAQMENVIKYVRSGCKIVIDTPAGLANY